MASVTIRGIDLQCDVSGNGPDLLWGHGLTSSRAREDVFGLLDWNRMRAVARVVRYDARGHGESESTPDPAPTTGESSPSISSRWRTR